MNVNVRTADGETCDTDLVSGLINFVSDDGYRVTLKLDNIEIVLRRDQKIDSEIEELDAHLGQNSVEAMVTIRGLNQ